MISSHKRVGLIVNPMAGRDIRRLVAHASLQSQPEKALAAHRIVSGLAVVPGLELLLPEDRQGFFGWLYDELHKEMAMTLVPRPNTWEDSTQLWVDLLVRAGADALIVVGGDGTQRNVAQAAPTVPVLPVAGGTNNVACYLGDQTAGGYAVARFLHDQMELADSAARAKVLHLHWGAGKEELALIDVALTKQTFTGAMAVWDPDDVLALVLSRAEAVRPGLSNVGGYGTPVAFEHDWGLYLRFGPGGTGVPTVLAPGLMAAFNVLEERRIAFGERISLSLGALGGTLALDGERTVVLSPGQSVDVELKRDGPWVLNPTRILSRVKHSR